MIKEQKASTWVVSWEGSKADGNQLKREQGGFWQTNEAAFSSTLGVAK
jgi:hypothetical protein